MKKLRFPILLVFGCLSITTLGLTVNTKNLFETFKPPQSVIIESPKQNSISPKQNVISPKQSAVSTAQQRAGLPEHVQYYFLFRHLSVIKETPVSAGFQAKAGLNSGQLQALTSIAVNNERELKRLDEKAEAIIAAFHAQNPPGRLPSGVVPPSMPSQINVLQQQREATILRYREQLSRMFGEAEFARFDAFVKDEIGGNTSSQNQ
ncbi:MAG TPA: hypothetical protein VF648_16140 [Pyrinomonadaceae bacterium]|jgi:hypothetical protein